MRPILTLIALALAALPQWEPTYHVYAVKYATLPDFPVSSLVAGADASRRMDIAMMVWLLESIDGRVILIDAGFYRDKFLARWKPRDYVRPSDAVRKLGIDPGEIYDVVISHVHWDHLDGVDLFPNATVWIQKDEYDYYVDGDGRPRHAGIDPDNAAALAALRRADRLEMIEGDAQEIQPGIVVYTGGRHTHASQYVGVQTPGGRVVLASDNLYLYENLDRGVPIAQTLDADANRRAQARMAALASRRELVVPGHDPGVFTRFPRVTEGVAAIPR